VTTGENGIEMATGSVTVSIVTYNSRQHLAACLDSVKRQSVACDVVVVDNASTDGTVELLRAAYPWVTVIANPVNRGFGAGHNQAAEEAGSEWVFMLNPDVVLPPNAIAVLLRVAEAEHATLVAPQLRFPDGTLQRSAHRRWPSWFSHLYQYNFLVLAALQVSPKFDATLFTPSDHSHRLTPKHVMGAAMLIRLDRFRAVGRFDEGFFLYFEETDLCRRLAGEGDKILYTPDVVVSHVFGGSSGEGEMGQGSPMYQASAYRYFRKHRGRAYAIGLWLMALTSLIANALLLPVARIVAALGSERVQERIDAGRTMTRRALAWHLSHPLGRSA
jgi:GT2 family glycosyltransferase